MNDFPLVIVFVCVKSLTRKYMFFKCSIIYNNKALWMGKDSLFQACFGVCGETTKNQEDSKIMNVL
jgi:hypothetical protein